MQYKEKWFKNDNSAVYGLYMACAQSIKKVIMLNSASWYRDKCHAITGERQEETWNFL